VSGAATLLSPTQHVAVDTILRQWRRAVSSAAALPIAQLLGADVTSKGLVARVVAEALSRRLYRINVNSLPPQPNELEALARLWQRESLLLPLALYMDAHDSDHPAGEAPPALERFLSREMGLVFVSLPDAPVTLSASSFSVDIDKPTPLEQQQAWYSALEQAAPSGDTAAEMARQLTGQFNLSLAAINAATTMTLADREAMSAAGQDVPPLDEQLWDTCRAITRPQLDLLAQRLDAKATWDDLVLHDEQLQLLRLIAAQVRHRSRVYEEWGFARKMNRGLGISALFAGESGVGKTMAAEVIANDLRLNLYRIDLSAVVSKFVGETEKNLRRVFDAAEQGGAILFFDEADALFGKRSEVKDSHDRYANIEINYLLQRMESYRGLAILATNMKNALDSAFMRRLRFIVNFSFPGLAERKLIWQKVFPPQTPTANLDFDQLARLNLTGGNIHSIAMNAAFLASASQPPVVTMPVVLEAARVELRKLDRPSLSQIADVTRQSADARRT
jgi:hypothetical protein